MNDDETIVIPKRQWWALYRLQQFVNKARRMPPFENDRKAALEDILDNISGTITELIKASTTISSTIGGIKNTDVYVPVHIVEAQALEIKNYEKEIKALKFENKKCRSEVIILEKSPSEITEQRRSAKRRIRKIEEAHQKAKLHFKESVEESKNLINALEEELRKKRTETPSPTKQMLRAIEKAKKQAYSKGLKDGGKDFLQNMDDQIDAARKKGYEECRKDTINERRKEKNDDVV